MSLEIFFFCNSGVTRKKNYHVLVVLLKAKMSLCLFRLSLASISVQWRKGWELWGVLCGVHGTKGTSLTAWHKYAWKDTEVNCWRQKGPGPWPWSLCPDWCLKKVHMVYGILWPKGVRALGAQGSVDPSISKITLNWLSCLKCPIRNMPFIVVKGSVPLVYSDHP